VPPIPPTFAYGSGGGVAPSAAFGYPASSSYTMSSLSSSTPSFPARAPMPQPSAPVPPRAAVAERPARRRRRLLPLLALCLCFTLIGGVLGGVVGTNADYVQGLLGLNSPVEDQPGADGSGAGIGEADATKPVVYQPGVAMSWEEVYRQHNQSVVAISTETASRNVFGQTTTIPAAGSGFVLTEDGYVATNNHVIDGATSIVVILPDGSSYKARLIGQDVTNDLAVLKIDAENLTALEWGDSEALSVGSPVAAIGNPLGELANSMTSGIISALDRSINIDGTPMTMLQIDASVSPGNSGGPLFNQYGQVIGLVSAKTVSQGVEGIGFAIPASIARDILDQIIQIGYVPRPSLGLTVYEIDASMARYYDLPVGLYLISVEEGSCADKAGLRNGDVVISFDGHAVATQDELVALRDAHKPGDTVEAEYSRDGQLLTASLVLDEAAGTAATQENQFPWSQQQPSGGM
jgi:serine protease Do